MTTRLLPATKRFIADKRGQPLGILRFFLSLIVGAILITVVLWQVAPPILNSSANATSATAANDATSWFRTAVENAPLLFLFSAVMGIVIYSVYDRTRLR